MKKFWWLLSICLLIVACEVKPQEIAYGSDGCHFCKMTIVDTKHAAQLVTEKGKSFKYDAIECMLNHLNEWNEVPIKYYLVTDYANPKVLIDASVANYLISEAIPSPMGVNLSAFENPIVREQMIQRIGGDILSWEQLQQNFIKE